MKSVISNTSDSGCGERAGEAVSAESSAESGAESAGEESGGSTHLAVRRHLAPLPGHPAARRLTGTRRSVVPLSRPGRLSPPHRLLTASSPAVPRLSPGPARLSESYPVPAALCRRGHPRWQLAEVPHGPLPQGGVKP